MVECTQYVILSAIILSAVQLIDSNSVVLNEIKLWTSGDNTPQFIELYRFNASQPWRDYQVILLDGSTRNIYNTIHLDSEEFKHSKYYIIYLDSDVLLCDICSGAVAVSKLYVPGTDDDSDDAEEDVDSVESRNGVVHGLVYVYSGNDEHADQLTVILGVNSYIVTKRDMSLSRCDDRFVEAIPTIDKTNLCPQVKTHGYLDDKDDSEDSSDNIVIENVNAKKSTNQQHMSSRIYPITNPSASKRLPTSFTIATKDKPALVTKRTTKPKIKHTTSINSRTLTPSTRRHTTASGTRRTIKPKTKHTTTSVTRRTIRPSTRHTTASVTRSAMKPSTRHTTAPVTRSTMKRSTMKPSTRHTTAPVTRHTMKLSTRHTTASITRRTMKPRHTTASVTRSTMTPKTKHTTASVTRSTMTPNTTASVTRRTMTPNTTASVTRSTMTPKTKHTTAPGTRSTMKPKTKHTTAPGTKSTMKPKTRHTTAPGTRSTVKPKTRHTTAPGTRSTIKPKTKHTTAPGTRSTMKPKTRHTTAPGTRSTIKPKTRHTTAPGTRSTMKPKTMPISIASSSYSVSTPVTSSGSRRSTASPRSLVVSSSSTPLPRSSVFSHSTPSTPASSSSAQKTSNPQSSNASTERTTTAVSPAPKAFVVINEANLVIEVDVHKYYVEVKGTPNASLSHISLVVFDGITNAMLLHKRLDANYTLNAYGLLVIGAQLKVLPEAVAITVYNHNVWKTPYTDNVPVNAMGLFDAIVVGNNRTKIQLGLLELMIPNYQSRVIIVVPRNILNGGNYTISRCHKQEYSENDPGQFMVTKSTFNSPNNCSTTGPGTRVEFKLKDAVCHDFTRPELQDKFVDALVEKVADICKCGVTQLSFNNRKFICGSLILQVTIKSSLMTPWLQGAIYRSFRRFVKDTDSLIVDGKNYHTDKCYLRCRKLVVPPSNSDGIGDQVKITVAVVAGCITAFVISLLLVVVYLKRRKRATHQFKLHRLDESDTGGILHDDEDDLQQDATFKNITLG